MNVPLAGLPLTADSVTPFGVTCRVPGVGGGDDDGDGEGEGDGDGDGDGDGSGGADWVGADDRSAPGDVLWLTVADDVGDPGADAGPRPGEDGPPAGLDAALGAPDVSTLPPPRATVEAWARCVPPATSSTTIPPAATATATAATPAAARGLRRTSCHHRGPDRMTGFGNPVRPNAPARCVTLTRSARPVGELSAPAFSTRSRRPSGGPPSGVAPAEAGRASPAKAGRASPAASPRAREPRGPCPAQAFVPRDRAQPGAELVRITEPAELGGGDGKGVRHGIGGLSRRVRIGQHGPAVGIERRRVTVIRLGEPVRVTVDDGRDELTVLHGANRSSPPMAASRKDITR